MRSGTSPALSARINLSEQVPLQPENYTAYSARRRSHLTPGVATRMSEANEERRSSRLQKQHPKARRQSAAALEPSQTFSYQPERSKTLPSEDEIYSYYNDENKPSESLGEAPEMLAPLQKPRFREDITNTQRMSTPTDLRHIGSFELGSLRITNGAATPNAANTPKARRGIAADSDVDNVSLRTTAVSLASLARRHPMEQGSMHELKQPRQLEIMVNPAELSIDPPSRSPSTATKQSAYSDQLGISRASSQRLETAPQIPGGATEFADFYRLDIDFRPSLFSPDLSMPSSPKLEAVSKHTAEEDELFEDAKSDLAVFEDARSEFERRSPLSERRSPLSERRSPLSEAPRRQNDELYLPAVEPVSQRRSEQTMDTSTHARLEPLAVTDSGYSSYTSLGSVESSRSQSKLRDASESPTERDDRELVQPAEVDMSSQPRVPKADYWRTQHAPGDMTRDYRAEPIVPPPMREAPSEPPKYQMQRPPIPTTATHIDDSMEPQPEAELIKSISNSTTTSPKRPPLLQSRTTGNVLQKSSQNRPNSLAVQGRTNSDETITPVKKKWHRHSSQLSSEVPITAQRIDEPGKTKVPAVPKQLSHTFKERARRLSGFRHTKTTVSDNVEPEKEKPAPPPSKAEVQRSIRRQSSPALMPGIRLVTAPSSIAPSPTSTPSRSPKSLSPPKDTAKDTQSRGANFECHITNSSTVATSLGASPYDAGASALSLSSLAPSVASAAAAGPPRRDRTGRLIGMDEESASNFARARSQVRAAERAAEAERREALVTRMAQSISEGSDSRVVAPVPNNSSFANQLAIQSQRTLTPSTAAAGVPPVPTLMVPDGKRQSPLMKGKREKVGPPPSLMNGRNRKHGILGFWGGSGSSKDAPLDVPKRPMPMGPVGSSGEIPAIVSAKSAGFTAPVRTKNLPSMAPQWKGPSPAELAEMALKARKEGRTSVDAQRRSMSANGIYDKKGPSVVSSRPNSVAGEREGEAGKGRRRGWSFRGRKEAEV